MTAKYAFMREHLEQFRLTAMCRVLGVNRSGYYAWAGSPDRARHREDDRLRGLIKHARLASGTVYGHRKITRELRESGERCSRHRVRRLMRAEGIRAEIGYGRKPRHRSGPAGVVENVVNRDFSPSAPNTRSFISSQVRSLESIAKLNRAKSRILWNSCSLIRMAQMSFSLSGAFWRSMFPYSQVRGVEICAKPPRPAPVKEGGKTSPTPLS